MLWPINATTTNLELSVSAQQRTGASHRSARFACAAGQHRYPMQGQKENHAVGGRCPGRAGKRPRFGRAMAIGNAGLTDGWSHRHPSWPCHGLDSDRVGLASSTSYLHLQ